MKFKNFVLKNKNLVTGLIAATLLAIMFMLSIFSGIKDSGIVDEIAHIPSGYSYVKYGDFRLNPEHPPLAKALAGVPLLFLDINDIRTDESWEGIGQWEAGWNMLYENGNNPNQIFFWSRFSMIILMLILGVVLFFWAKEWFGRKIALLVLAMYCFYPDFIGHGHYVTTDVAASLGYVITIYSFDKFIKKQNLKYLLLASLFFAIAQLLKFSSFLLFGVLLFLIIYRAYQDKTEQTPYLKTFWKYFKFYFFISVISLLIVWAVYIPFVHNMTPELERRVIDMNLTADPDMDTLRHFFYFLANNDITRGLGHYLLGVALVFKRVVGGNATFIMGQLSDKSIPWYFPVAWLIKTPLPVIVLFLWSLVNLIVFRPKSKTASFRNWLLLTPVVVYWAVTLKGSLNIGIRHLMPTVPFVLLFIGLQMHRYISGMKALTYQGVIIAGLILAMAISTISYFPQYLSYFNILVPRDARYKYMTDYSLDW